MKKGEKNLGKVLSAVFAGVVCSLIVFGFDAQAASLRGKDNEEKVFYYLVEKMEMNNAGAVGIVANIERESSFNPKTSGDSGTSYGICQWHADRFEALKRFCKREGYNYKTLEGQLNYLDYELNTDSYFTRSVLNPIMAVKNNKNGAYMSAYIWCYYYEIPADRSQRAEERGNVAQKNYWPKYKDVVLSLVPGEKYKTAEGTFIAIDKKTVSFKAVADKKATELNIPDTVKIGDIKAKVVEIAPGACKNNKKLTGVVIGKNVKVIGENAFSGCKKLETVKIKSTKITAFEDGCFKKIKKKASFYVKSSVKSEYKKMLKEVAPSDIRIKKLS